MHRALTRHHDPVSQTPIIDIPSLEAWLDSQPDKTVAIASFLRRANSYKMLLLGVEYAQEHHLPLPHLNLPHLSLAPEDIESAQTRYQGRHAEFIDRFALALRLTPHTLLELEVLSILRLCCYGLAPQMLERIRALSPDQKNEWFIKCLATPFFHWLAQSQPELLLRLLEITPDALKLPIALKEHKNYCTIFHYIIIHHPDKFPEFLPYLDAVPNVKEMLNQRFEYVCGLEDWTDCTPFFKGLYLDYLNEKNLMDFLTMNDFQVYQAPDLVLKSLSRQQRGPNVINFIIDNQLFSPRALLRFIDQALSSSPRASLGLFPAEDNRPLLLTSREKVLGRIANDESQRHMGFF